MYNLSVQSLPVMTREAFVTRLAQNKVFRGNRTGNTKKGKEEEEEEEGKKEMEGRSRWDM